jgi:hypothetical protein
MYALNRMVLATGGTYFVLKKESDYDQQKLYAKYKPDICSKFTYDERMQQIPLRREVKEAWQELGTFYLPYDLRRDGQVSEMLQRAMAGRNYCINRAKQLDSLMKSSKPQGHNWSRWLAHAALTRAELLRLRFMLGQYYATLQKAQKRYGSNLRGRKKRIIVQRGKAPEDYEGPKEAKQEHDVAQQYIKLVMEQHKGTPWEELAQRMKRHVHPWKAVLRDYPEPHPPGHKGPPALQF